MADSKTTGLNNSNVINGTDIFPMVFDVTGTPVTEKRTFAELIVYIAASLPPAWGGITGTLSDQTDLVVELDSMKELSIAYSIAL